MPHEPIAIQPGEFMAYLLEADQEAAEVLRIRQHAEGFAANISGTDLQDFRPAAWQDGWFDANDLGQIAPIEFLRMNAEI